MSWRQSTFLLPSLIALLGMAGLFAALLGDGWWDTLAWLGLGAQAGLGLWPLLPRPRKPSRQRKDQPAPAALTAIAGGIAGME